MWVNATITMEPMGQNISHSYKQPSMGWNQRPWPTTIHSVQLRSLTVVSAQVSALLEPCRERKLFSGWIQSDDQFASKNFLRSSPPKKGKHTVSGGPSNPANLLYVLSLGWRWILVASRPNNKHWGFTETMLLGCWQNPAYESTNFGQKS